MTQSPAAYLRALDRDLPVMPHLPRTATDWKSYVRYRTLLPALADVVEAAEQWKHANWGDRVAAEQALTVGLDRLAAAVSALKRRLPGEGG